MKRYRAVLTRFISHDETCCGDYDKGTPGIVEIQDDGGEWDFYPDCYPDGWGFYFLREDFQIVRPISS